MLAGFRDFIARRNVVDLSTAVVVGAAATAMINAVVDDIFSPLISAALNSDKIENSLVLTIPTLSGGHVQLKFGTVMLAIIKFLLVSAVVYFVIILPMNHLKDIKRTLEHGLPGPLGALSAIITGSKKGAAEDAEGEEKGETVDGNEALSGAGSGPDLGKHGLDKRNDTGNDKEATDKQGTNIIDADTKHETGGRDAHRAAVAPDNPATEKLLTEIRDLLKELATK